MARPLRVVPAGFVYHVGNRGSRKGPLFDDDSAYVAFERLVAATREMYAVRIIAYCLMFNHWHFLLWPLADDVLSSFMKTLTEEHATQFRRNTGTVGQGAVYQARFWHSPTHDDLHLLAAWRYIERNPVTAGLVTRAEDWPWSSASLARRDRAFKIDLGPVLRPDGWLEMVNSSYCTELIDDLEL